MTVQPAAVEPQTPQSPLVPLTRQELATLSQPFRLEREMPQTSTAPAADMAQLPLDVVEEASLESFPCSDAPGYTPCHV